MDNEQVQLDAVNTAGEQQKMLSQDEVNRIVGAAKASAAESARRQAYAEMQGKSESPGVDINAISEQVSTQLLNKLTQEAQLEQQQKAYEAQQKMEADLERAKAAAAKEYEDFDANALDNFAYKDVLLAATLHPNAKDILHELHTNPKKAADIQLFGKLGDWKTFNKNMKTLSESLAKNKEAVTNTPKAQAPLSQIKPSTVGVAGDKPGLKEFKQKKAFMN